MRWRTCAAAWLGALLAAATLLLLCAVFVAASVAQEPATQPAANEESTRRASACLRERFATNRERRVFSQYGEDGIIEVVSKARSVAVGARAVGDGFGCMRLDPGDPPPCSARSQAIFSCIGTTNKQYVEFGVEDGKQCTTRNLRENFNWTGAPRRKHQGTRKGPRDESACSFCTRA